MHTLNAEAGDCTLTCNINLRHQALYDYDRAHNFDLHALLCQRQLTLQTPDTTLTIGHQHPIQTLRHLARDLHILLGGRPWPSAQAKPLLRLQDDALTLTLPEESAWGRRHRTPSQAHPGPITLPLNLHDLTTATVHLIEHLTARLLCANNTLQHEARLQSLGEQAQSLRALLRETRDLPTPTEEHSTQTTVLTQESIHEVTPTWPPPLHRMRRLVYGDPWRHMFSGPADIIPTQSHIVLSDESSLRSLSWETGQPRWTAQGLHLLGTWPNTVLATDGLGGITALSARQGQPDWRASLRHGHRLMGVFHLDTDTHTQWAMVTDQGAEAFDLQGQHLWSWSRGHGAVVDALATPQGLIIAFEDSTLINLDPRNGQPRWRTRCMEDHHETPLRWIRATHGHLLAFARDPGGPRGIIVSLDPATGTPTWTNTTQGVPGRNLLILRDHILWTITSPGEGGLEALHLHTGQTLWRKTFRGASTAGPGTPLALPQDHIAWLADDGILRAHRLRTGSVDWKQRITRPDEPLWTNIPLLRSQETLWACGDQAHVLDPSTGRILHKLESLPTDIEGFWHGPQLRALLHLEHDEDANNLLQCHPLGGFLAPVT